MGIPLTPGETNNNCTHCFAVDATPLILYCSFTGIKKGDSWFANLKEPWNEVVVAGQTGGCQWGRTLAPMTMVLQLFGDSQFLTVRFGETFIMFDSGPVSPCLRFYENSITSPVGSFFYGGKCHVTYRSPADSGSLLHVASLLNIETGPKSFCENFPVDADEAVYRFAQKKDSSNVKILFDIT